MEQGRERKAYLDIAKGIGILLVVAGHSDSPLQSVLYQFHVPLFFFVSGMLFNGDKPPGEYIKGKIHSLYFPYIAANFAVLPIVAGKEGWNIVVILKKSVKILLMLDKIYLIGASWFLASLLWISVGYYGIYYIIRKRPYFWTRCADLLIVICGILAMYVHLPYKLDTALVGAAFYIIGKIWTEHGKMCLEKKWLPLGLILFWTSVVNQVDMASNTYTYPVLFLISACVGSVCVLIISNALRNIRAATWLTAVGRNTRPILLWHFCWFKVAAFMQILWYHWDMSCIWEFPVCSGSGAWWILYFLVGCGGPLLVVYGRLKFTNKYL